MADKKDDTKLTMLFANREERDILMKKELDEIVKNSQIYEKFFFYEMKKTVENVIK